MFVKLSLFSTDAPILGFVQYKSQMFFMARSFNQDISRWNVGNVKEMVSPLMDCGGCRDAAVCVEVFIAYYNLLMPYSSLFVMAMPRTKCFSMPAVSIRLSVNGSARQGNVTEFFMNLVVP